MGTKGRKKKSDGRRERAVQGPRLVPGSPRPNGVTPPVRANGTPHLQLVTSDVRWSKVKTAQARMAVDYYDREDVKEKLLDAVLEELDRS